MIRKIVQIDSDKCNGCGLCVPACAEGAIRIVDGKAVLAADNLCDGLGACLGDCPQDAIHIVERDAEQFDEEAVERHLKQAGHGNNHQAAHHNTAGSGGCPGSRVISFARPASEQQVTPANPQSSQLAQWPVQLHLVPVTAPYFQNADLLIAADCVPFAYPDFHRDFLSGKALVVGCPKLDDNSFYLAKLTELFKVASIRSLTVLRMEVPCCSGIVMAARQALADSGKEISFREVVIGIDGGIKSEIRK
ncbi:4Fe-4S binding protein [Geobacter pelophilus]|uniref:4Fe-4S binding protein n=1 Tax=Geoanaerobacter pelophilus TaxID=60036 RepID=A0AAW4L6F3_9BACT|nr:4Fe-4S binding protein [Geoanaerobacter pelophilus]MBT0663786.1 4Fe-4S binding protein [Geoanaerobacter pelophilus]